ncbi:MAG: hypothetical protein II757_05345 [Bacteroidales bacterium]|nr:hypothetical protein [Bacteroidales bacterium]
MKKFLQKLLLFSGILYLLALGVDMAMTYKIQHLETAPYANWNDIYCSDNLQHDMLIMGSSRAFVQFNPKILDSILQVDSYNLGCNGQGMDSELLKYDLYRRHATAKPKYILYEVSPGTMYCGGRYEEFQYDPYVYDKYLWEQVRKRRNLSWADRFVPCWRYIKNMKIYRDIMVNKSYYTNHDNILYKGFIDHDKKWDGSRYKKVKEINYDKSPKAIRAFEDFLNGCQREGIQVVMVYAPYYIGATAKVKDVEGMHRMFDGIAERHNCKTLDYTHHPVCNDTCYFYNAIHLNRKGATLFSTQLAHDLDSLGIVQP